MDDQQKIKVIVCIQGGVVQSIKADSQNVDVDILDYDDLKMAQEDSRFPQNSPNAKDEYSRYLEIEKRYYSMEYLLY